MNRDDRIRNQLGTVVSAAVRLGMTQNGMAREALAAEVRDLVELAIQVTNPALMELSAGGERYLAFQQAEEKRKAAFWRNVDASVPADTLASQAPRVEDAIAASLADLEERGIRVTGDDAAEGAVARPAAPVCMAFADADDMHDHACSKERGHADGPGGSDHLCEQCGQLFTALAIRTFLTDEIEL
jgi:hypothetical protein